MGKKIDQGDVIQKNTTRRKWKENSFMPIYNLVNNPIQPIITIGANECKMIPKIGLSEFNMHKRYTQEGEEDITTVKGEHHKCKGCNRVYIYIYTTSHTELYRIPIG